MNSVAGAGATVAWAKALISGRRAVRAFLPKPVEMEMVKQILDLARYAPSGSNTQPWKVYVATDDTQRLIIDRLSAAFNTPDAAIRYVEEYAYYPKQWQPPYIDRRRKVGWDLYTLLGIGNTDKQRMQVQHRRNVEFFGAPVSLFFTIDRIMEQGSWLDYGMFLQNVLLAARAHGLATCPQAAVNPFHSMLQDILKWSDAETMVCGMSMGFEDRPATESQLMTECASVESFARFFE